jgi:phage tail-like protein
MSGRSPTLRSPHPLASGLPAIYGEPDLQTSDEARIVHELVEQGATVAEVAEKLARPPEWVQARLELAKAPMPGGSFASRFSEALDDVLAPVFAALDNLPAYFDPQLAPPDFLDWLGSWVGLALDERWSLDRRRRLVASAVSLYALRGTARGLARHVEIFAGVEPEIEESGGVVWATTPDTEFPGEWPPKLVVRLPADEEDGIDARRLAALVDAVKPAHVPASLEVTARMKELAPA